MMFEDTSTMEDFSTKQGFLFYSFPLCEEEKEKIDGFLTLLDRSGVAELIWEKAKKGQAGRPSYDPYKMFSAVLLGFALGSLSLREIESSCHPAAMTCASYMHWEENPRIIRRSRDS